VVCGATQLFPQNHAEHTEKIEHHLSGWPANGGGRTQARLQIEAPGQDQDKG
jgi:hypothetical protein